MKNKAYIVVNEQQEREVLEKLERKGLVWGFDKGQREFVPSECYAEVFPYVISVGTRMNLSTLSEVGDEEIVFDGRKEENMSEKYVVSQEFMSNLKNWKRDLMTYGKHGYFVGYMDIGGLPACVYDWLGENISNEENNNRLIAIIRWVNGEDVFEVEKPKKWVVRSKETDNDGDYAYVLAGSHGISINGYNISRATKFDTKEEAESWANSHQEVVSVEE